jgi:4-amino-4-deoxy-L-arabinose transferase-like glycosyltransferase
MLLAQAALGVGSVALLVATVRRWSGPGVALAAGALLAVTPVAVIMFRFDDPDPMLTFLLVAASYALVRGVDAAPRRAGTAWLVVCGVLVGTGFLAKMGVALFVVPAFGLVHLVVADVSWRRRIGQLAAGLAGLVVGAGWFMALVAWWPASSRPWIGGSTDNSLWQLAVGYNGLSRILGRGSSLAATAAGTPAAGGPGRAGHGGGPGAGGAGFAGGRFGGQPGILRLFTEQFAGQISWLLPAALIALVALLWTTRRAPRGDRLRAAVLLWGTWLIVATLVLSLMQGMVHTYYTVVMAPPLAALVALGAAEAWRRRDQAAARAVAAVGIAISAIWSAVILSWTPTFAPGLLWAVVVAGLVAVVLVLGPRSGHRGRGLPATTLVVLIAVIGGPVAYAADTVASPQPGNQASAGPPTAGGRGGWSRGVGRATATGGRPSQRAAAGGQAFGRGRQTDPALDQLLHHAGTTWSAAVPTTMAAASLELSSNTSVMGVGGFSGSDPAPTLAQFQSDVAQHEIRYYLGATAGSDGWGGRGSSGVTSAISQWVQGHYRSVVVGGQTVYDLAEPVA